MKNPGELIRSRRELRGLSQKELARLAKTSQGQISRVERGAVSPSVETLERLLQAMGDELDLTAGPSRPTTPPRRATRRTRGISIDPASLLY